MIFWKSIGICKLKMYVVILLYEKVFKILMVILLKYLVAFIYFDILVTILKQFCLEGNDLIVTKML